MKLCPGLVQLRLVGGQFQFDEPPHVLHIIQGDATVIGGLGRVVYPMGMTVEAMTAKPTTALKIVVAGNRDGISS